MQHSPRLAETDRAGGFTLDSLRDEPGADRQVVGTAAHAALHVVDLGVAGRHTSRPETGP